MKEEQSPAGFTWEVANFSAGKKKIYSSVATNSLCQVKSVFPVEISSLTGGWMRCKIGGQSFED